MLGIHYCYRTLLYCKHEKADDRLLYHISHAIKV